MVEVNGVDVWDTRKQLSYREGNKEHIGPESGLLHMVCFRTGCFAMTEKSNFDEDCISSLWANFAEYGATEIME